MVDPDGAIEHVRGRHASDCAVHNAPAYDPGDCDCGFILRSGEFRIPTKPGERVTFTPAANAPDWEGFGREALDEWPEPYDLEAPQIFDLAVKHRLLVAVPGGFNPEEHTNGEDFGAEPGDPWFEKNFKGV